MRRKTINSLFYVLTKKRCFLTNRSARREGFAGGTEARGKLGRGLLKCEKPWIWRIQWYLFRLTGCYFNFLSHADSSISKSSYTGTENAGSSQLGLIQNTDDQYSFRYTPLMTHHQLLTLYEGLYKLELIWYLAAKNWEQTEYTE